MKYLITFSILLVCTGCAANKPTQPVSTSQAPRIYIDPEQLEDKETAPLYLAYAIAKSTWEPTYLSDGSPDKLAQEAYARTTMLRVWMEAKDIDSEKSHPTLDVMENILNAGYLREMIWLKHQDALGDQPDDLDIAGFKQWMDENPDKLIQAIK